MSQYEFDDILRKYLAGKCTAAEEKAVLEWYETFIQQTEVELSPVEKQLLEQKIWSKISSGTENFNVPAKVKWLQQRWVRIAAAACVIGMLVTGGYWYFNQKPQSSIATFSHIKVPEGYIVASNEDDTNRLLTLSDGSTIELHPQSSLYYPERFVGRTRNVYLTGNAFFRIAHDTSMHFVVHTDEGLVTEVLGTSFYVLHDKVTNKIEVSVITGKVSVYEEKEKDSNKTIPENRIVLTPNQKVLYKPLNNQFVTSLVEDPKPITQPANQPPLSFNFDETPLTKVLKSLETVYGITIQMENESLGNCHFTGDITKQNLYDKLDIVCRSTQSSYEVRGTLIYLRGKGCD